MYDTNMRNGWKIRTIQLGQNVYAPSSVLRIIQESRVSRPAVAAAGCGLARAFAHRDVTVHV